jgi:hypothetical protein
MQALGACSSAVEQWTHNPLVAGSNPAGPITQPTEDKVVTATGELGDKSENPNLASGLFSKSEIDPDLRTVIERWDELSVELRRAIVKMVQ